VCLQSALAGPEPEQREWAAASSGPPAAVRGDATTTVTTTTTATTTAAAAASSLAASSNAGVSAAVGVSTAADVSTAAGVVEQQLVLTPAGQPLQLTEVFGLDGWESELCVVCLTEERDTILLPCRHLCVCASCFDHLERCPVCRTGFTSFLRF